ILGAVAAGRVLGRLQAKSLAALALALGTVIWAAHNETYIEKWVEWNYSGYEGKPLWPAFKRVNDYLRGGFDGPRVAYEHAAQTKGVGTLRAFESLPLFSGRATLEGLYIQSSLSSPFIFYMQSEISQIFSSPLFKYNYSRFDLERGRRHMELFNVGQYVSVTGRTRAAAEQTPGFNLEKSFPPFAVFSLPGNSGRYVAQPRFKPVLALSRDPKRDGFAWFRLGDLDVPVVFSSEAGQKERLLFAGTIEPSGLPGRLRQLPRQELPPTPDIRETVKDNEIIIEGAVPGRPLWIRVSYHPNWLVKGADRVWRAGPAFMLVFPTHQRVRLYFGRTWPDYLGLGLTVLGIFYAVWFRARSSPSSRPRPADLAAIMTRVLEPPARLVRPRARLVLIGVVSLAALGVFFLILTVGYQDPQVIHNRGLRLFTAKEYDRAETVFNEALRKFPLSLVVDQTLNHLALCYFHREMYEQAKTAWSRFETEYPESRLLPEALYHIGLCELRRDRVRKASEVWVDLTARFPGDRWAREATARLAEIENIGEKKDSVPLPGLRNESKGP
ncbi:MAG: 6-pyruvoyl-tetrahydropterin synthase-related protein, partial [Thermodesulfobacteriota bacterium]|nr:6-pyruvoyl-tetrahydropterin synthase-related protein [Thermodesulfobacteriota bacterium]